MSGVRSQVESTHRSMAQALARIGSVCAVPLLMSVGCNGAGPPGADADEKAQATAQAFTANGSFYVSNNQLYDANGSPFVIRGINLPWAYYESNVASSIATYAGSGKANTVRIIIDHRYGNSAGSAEDSAIQSLIQQCINNKMAVILTLMDPMGSDNASDLTTAANFWISRASWLTGSAYKKYVMINVANEWGGSWNNHANWKNAYKNAIHSMRDAGINNTLTVDAAGYGQEYASLTDSSYGANDLVQELNGWTSGYGDNILFALHMYDQFYNSSTVSTALNAAQNNLYVSSSANDGLIVEEFGNSNYESSGYNNRCPDGSTSTPGQCPVDAYDIMSQAQNGTSSHSGSKIGWLAWSWGGNSSNLSALNMSNSMTAWQPTSWGNTVVTGSNGTSSTSSLASIFGSGGGGGTQITVQNPGFESGNLSGWSLWSDDGMTGASYVQNSSHHTGSWELMNWASSAFRVNTGQVIGGLANGSYTASAWLYSGGGQNSCAFVVKNYGGSELDQHCESADSAWRQVSTTFNVSNGQVEIDFWSDGKANNWVAFDDVSLTKN